MSESPPSSGYTFGPFRMDVGSYQLFRDADEVVLTSKVFDTLLLLVRQRHRVVTKEELLSSVWRDSNVTDDSLIQCVSSLRRALGDEATKPRYVSTVARRGYRFIAPVSEWTAVDPEPIAPPAPAETLAAAPSQGRGRLVWPILTVALLAALVAGWFAGARFSRPDAGAAMPNGVLRFSQAAPAGTKLASGGALSPDASHLAFAADDATSGQPHLWVRALDSAEPRRIEGTEGASRPFWSPDSQFIGFFADGRLRTIRLTGGPSTDLVAVGPRPTGGAWSPRGQIIFSSWLSGFSSISASGGPATRVTELAQGEAAHAWPQFLPDGDRFIYSVYGGSNAGTIFAAQLSTGERTRLLEAGAGAVFAPGGFLLFTRNGILTGQQFDPDTLTLAGEPFNLVTGSVMSPSMTNGTLLSASSGGLVAFGGATGESELAWFDRTGRRLGALTAPVQLHNPMLSLDETRVFANTYPPDQTGVWLTEIERGATSRLVPDAATPVPSPDGQRVAFTASLNNAAGIFARPLAGGAAGENETVLLTSDRKVLTDWSRDGRHLVFQAFTPERGQDLWYVPFAGSRTAVPLLQTAANEIQGELSPDGNWLAYASDESGTWEVYVQAFPGGNQKLTVSTAGGAEPQWRADGRELFYLADNHALMAVAVTGGRTLQVGRPQALFRPDVVGEATTYRTHYAVSADGQRFLIDVLRDPALDPITVLLNWTARRSAQ